MAPSWARMPDQNFEPDLHIVILFSTRLSGIEMHRSNKLQRIQINAPREPAHESTTTQRAGTLKPEHKTRVLKVGWAGDDSHAPIKRFVVYLES